MSKTETSGMTQQPPYGAVKWFADFFKLLERIVIDKVDVSFLKANKIATGNEYKLMSGLRFLALIDRKGVAKARMTNLRVIGKEFKAEFEKMVRDAYSLLFKKLPNLEQAQPQDVTNCLISDYKMARSTARKGAKIFVFLAQKAEIPISQQLAKIRTPELEVTRKRTKKNKRESKGKRIVDDEQKGVTEVPEEMLKIEYGDRFIMFLRKGNRSVRERTAKIAKQFLDTYVQEAEEES